MFSRDEKFSVAIVMVMLVSFFLLIEAAVYGTAGIVIAHFIKKFW